MIGTRAVLKKKNQTYIYSYKDSKNVIKLIHKFKNLCNFITYSSLSFTAKIGIINTDSRFKAYF